VAAHLSTRALLERSLGAGVAFVPGHAFYPDPAGDAELRICFSSVLPQAADGALRRLAGALAELTSASQGERRALVPVA
jgi:DNA-binding transcriptional MocR family regulator